VKNAGVDYVFLKLVNIIWLELFRSTFSIYFLLLSIIMLDYI